MSTIDETLAERIATAVGPISTRADRIERIQAILDASNPAPDDKLVEALRGIAARCRHSVTGDIKTEVEAELLSLAEIAEAALASHSARGDRPGDGEMLDWLSDGVVELRWRRVCNASKPGMALRAAITSAMQEGGV